MSSGSKILCEIEKVDSVKLAVTTLVLCVIFGLSTNRLKGNSGSWFSLRFSAFLGFLSHFSRLSGSTCFRKVTMEPVRVIFLMILVTLGKLTKRSSLFFF